MRSFAGLSTSAYARQPLSLPPFDHPSWSDFGWTIALGVAAALFTYVAVQMGRKMHEIVMRRPFVLLPAAGLAIAGLAIGFSEWTGHGTEEVLFSGQDALPGLVRSTLAPGRWARSCCSCSSRVRAGASPSGASGVDPPSPPCSSAPPRGWPPRTFRVSPSPRRSPSAWEP